MFYPRQVLVLFVGSLLGLSVIGMTPRGFTSAPSAQVEPVEIATSVAEGRLAEFSANGARFTLVDDLPEARLTMRRLFNLADADETAAPRTREFVLSSRAPEIVDQFKPGQLLRVRYRIGNDPCVAIHVEACADSDSDRIPSVREGGDIVRNSTESKLSREIRWNLNEDSRLSVQARTITIQHDHRGIVLEGSVASEMDKMLVEEKVQRLAAGAGVLSKLKVETRDE